jgi:dCTP deaminase
MLAPDVLRKLEGIEQRFEELTALLSDPAVAGNGDRFRKVAKERASIEPTVNALHAYRKLVQDIADNEALLADADLREMAKEELAQLRPHIDPAEEQPELTRLVETPGDEPFILHPGEFVLASTYEVVTLPDDISARLEGKSSIGRLGLLTHSTAGFIDAGFSGHVTLELSNVATLPIKLWPGMKIGQLCFFRLTSPAEQPYGSGASGSRYQGQRGPTPSKSYQNFYRTQI